jgi:hypothetical protein
MRTRKWVVVVASLLAIVAPGLGAGPASAAPVPWVSAACATGEFGPLQFQGENVIIPATATVCSPWSADQTFTVVEFRPDKPTATATRWNLRPYATSGPKAVSAAYEPAPQIRPTVGVCVMSSPVTRLACVRLDTTIAMATTATAIPVDDALVSAPVTYDDDAPHHGKGTGFCGTCLVFPA